MGIVNDKDKQQIPQHTAITQHGTIAIIVLTILIFACYLLGCSVPRLVRPSAPCPAPYYVMVGDVKTEKKGVKLQGDESKGLRLGVHNIRESVVLT